MSHSYKHICGFQPGVFFKRWIIALIPAALFLGHYEITFAGIREENKIEFYYRAESRAAFAQGENTPFWLVSNIHGLGSPRFNNGYVRGEIYKPLANEKKFSWGAGADITGAWNLPAPFAIRQLYGELRYRGFWLSIGSRNFDPLYNDTRLSSGDLLFSGNAMDIPQIRISTYGFQPFWGTKGWLHVNAYLSYGKFTDTKWMKNWVRKGSYRTAGVLFCSRGLWLRVGNEKVFPLTADVGIQMGTQFGGYIYQPNKIIKMPTGFIDWLKAIVPLSGGDSTPEGEQTNIQGNMTGEYNINVSFSPTPDWKLRAYFEHYFEDQSQMTFEYGPWKDGLWGMEITFPENQWLGKFVFEYVATADQTGPVNHDSTPAIPEQVSGSDSYYTHYLYRAWQNWGMSMGTPLAISPLYNRDHELTIYNTRFKAFHWGLEGSPIPLLRWRALFTYSRNWGTWILPLPHRMDNFSGLLEIEGRLPDIKGLYGKVAAAWDHGELLGKNFGGMISIGYEGNFGF